MQATQPGCRVQRFTHAVVRTPAPLRSRVRCCARGETGLARRAFISTGIVTAAQLPAYADFTSQLAQFSAPKGITPVDAVVKLLDAASVLKTVQVRKSCDALLVHYMLCRAWLQCCTFLARLRRQCAHTEPLDRSCVARSAGSGLQLERFTPCIRGKIAHTLPSGHIGCRAG